MKTLRSLFVLAAALVSTASIAPAQTVAPFPVPTIIKTAPYTINAPGYYQLGANLYYAGDSNISNDAIITIAASNVTLDFAGHYISGPNNSPASELDGVYAYERGNLTIQNGTVAFCGIGIDLEGNRQAGSLNINQRVRNMLVSYCYIAGIFFVGATNSDVLDNRISFIGNAANAFGFYDFNGTGNKAVGNTVTNVTTANNIAYGFYSDGRLTALNNTVSNVTCSGSPGSAYGIRGTIFTVNNTISGCYNGVYNGGKYMGNLTSGCTTPFTGGTAVGVNH